MIAVRANCGLCGLDCGPKPLAARFAGSDLRFCCAGCLNVYSILSESGVLASGQDFRDSELYRRSLKLGLISNRESQSAAGIPEDAETREAVYHVGGMWCASCAWLIEHALSKERGVRSAEVLFASDLLRVRYCPQYLPPERIALRVESLGYRASEHTGDNEQSDAERRDLLLRLGIAAFLSLNVMTFSLVVYASYFGRVTASFGSYVPFLLMALATPSVFYCAAPILRIAWRGALARSLRMESLLALGILTAYGYSAVQAFLGTNYIYFDTACAIVTLVLTGKVIERAAKEKTARAVTLLYRLMPRKARVAVEGRETFVSVEALQPGTVFLVKSGERIPADGVVLEGRSHADESVLTGESAPRSKGPGDAVVCGSLNTGGVLRVTATRTAAESTLAQVIRAVEQALASRTEVERTVDRVSRAFTPAVLLISALTFAGWYWRSGHPAPALMHAIAVLVIACPCALGIATPLALTCAVAAASRRGILVSDTRVLETIRRVDVMVLDKTGTVTEGNFALLETAGDASRMMALAALESCSEHPLARAVTRSHTASAAAHDLELRDGAGIAGTVEGERYFIGSRRMAGDVSAFEAQAQQWQERGHTVAFFGWGGETRGACAFGDRIRPDAVALCEELRRRGIRTLLVSGDARSTTAFVASAIGVAEFVSDALPSEKAALIQRLRREGAVVAMIGDGVNDAPSLAQADLGIALGSGADIAMQAAPLVIMSGSLTAVTATLDLARRAFRIVRQNLFWAFAYNAVGIALAIAGVLNPILAAGAMVLSSLSVIGNSRRLR